MQFSKQRMLVQKYQKIENVINMSICVDATIIINYYVTNVTPMLIAI